MQNTLDIFCKVRYSNLAKQTLQTKKISSIKENTIMNTTIIAIVLLLVNSFFLMKQRNEAQTKED